MTIALVLLWGCASRQPVPEAATEPVTASSTPQPAAVPIQTVLFEREYVNHAWSVEDRGHLIDCDGRVFEFRGRSHGLPLLRSQWPSGAIAAKYVKVGALGIVIPADRLAEMQALLERAADGTIQQRATASMDLGVTTWTGYLADEGSGVVTGVVLRGMGDWSIKNSRPEAVEIADWLDVVLPHE